MARAQAESVIKNIIREIAHECAGKGQVVSETLVAFMVGKNFLISTFLKFDLFISYFRRTNLCKQKHSRGGKIEKFTTFTFANLTKKFISPT